MMLLSRDPAISVIGEVGDGAAAIALADQLKPSIVIMDVRMPGLDGVEATRQIVLAREESDHPVRVLILTTFDEDEVVYDALRAGAHGFLVKHMAPQRLLEAVKTIASGDSWIDPSVAATVIKALQSVPTGGRASVEAVGRLTRRECEVLTMMAHGMSNGDISAELVLSEATVKTHVARILMKTGSRDRTQAVVMAYQSGLVTPRTAPWA